ncbi:MAG: hypothetical protein ACK4E4_01485 [Rhodocyclaceae bacterium]
MLVWLGVCAVVSFLTALGAMLAAVSPAPVLHLFFAFGALPLIFGAIGHFVPVLTKSRVAGPAIHYLPLVVQAAGIVIPFGLMGSLPQWSLHLAAMLDAAAALLMLFWVSRRLRNALGSPHPGASWYGAALLCLFFAVSLVPLWLVIPELRPPSRLFHLHLNTLGFIGLAALGTLPVLLPTALRLPEPMAATRLRVDLLPAFAGAVLIAAGAAAGYWLSIPGALLFAWVVGRDLIAWWRAYGRKIGAGETAPLLIATIGLLFLLVAGLAHGAGWLAARSALAGYVALFLLPLVTGALAQLLPVWRFPGADTPARTAMQRRLTGAGRFRALLFFIAGLAFLFDAPFAGVPAALALADFVLRLMAALYNSRQP